MKVEPMTPESERWLTANDDYLAGALDWLRARAEQLAADAPTAATGLARGSGGADLAPGTATTAAVAVAEPAPADGARRRRLLGRLLNGSPGASGAPGMPGTNTTSAMSGTERTPDMSGVPNAGGQASAGPAPARPRIAMPPAMMAAETAAEPPPLIVLARRMGLSEFERLTLLLCLAVELDPSISTLYARAQHDAQRPFPTFALALRMFDDPAWDVMSPERPLRYWRLLEIHQPGTEALIRSALTADERIVNYLKGLNYLDDRLSALLMPVRGENGLLPASQQDVADDIARQVERAGSMGTVPLFQLLGADSQSKLLIAHACAARLGLTLYRLPAEQLPAQAGELETFIRLWRRESALLPIALYLDAASVERGGAQLVSMRRLTARDAGLLFLDVRETLPEIASISALESGRDCISFEVVRPTPVEQLAAWTEALGADGAGQAERLYGHFNFNLPTIRQVAATARAEAAGGASLAQALWRGSLRRARPALDQLAQVVEAKAGWHDLALPPAEKTLLRQIVDQVKARATVYDSWGFRARMNRGLGISVLFAGESGTGKTMAAEVIADELGLLLFRIDLASVVNKYIGETEKNLRKLFDAAEDGGAILFFDEADALFGKRSEVKDSHDRYANIEINYLLQRIEAFRGLAILATNMKFSLDGAFMRRLRFIVNFPFPGPAERVAIWRKVFPPQTPLGALDHERLARLNLTGGSIHNIALHAAFLAAGQGTAVTMPLLLEAARSECRKLDKPVSEADFRWLDAAPSQRGTP